MMAAARVVSTARRAAKQHARFTPEIHHALYFGNELHMHRMVFGRKHPSRLTFHSPNKQSMATTTTEPSVVHLVSSDGERFELPVSVAMKSGLLKEILEQDRTGAAEDIPIAMLEGRELAWVRLGCTDAPRSPWGPPSSLAVWTRCRSSSS
jgi:hypothetical protein